MPATTLWGWIPNVALVPGPAGPLPAQMATDSLGRASLRTRPDSQNTIPEGEQPPSSLYLSIVNALTTNVWTNTGDAPVATPLTQQSILDVVQTYGGGLTEVGPFEVPSLASPAGATVELESIIGVLCGAIKALGFFTDRDVFAGLKRTRPMTIGPPDAPYSIQFDTTGLRLNTPPAYGLGVQLIGSETLVDLTKPITLITDLSAPVSALLTINIVFPGTYVVVKCAATSAPNPITISDTTGALIDGATTYILSTPLSYVHLVSDGTAWWSV